MLLGAELDLLEDFEYNMMTSLLNMAIAAKSISATLGTADVFS